jgi:hypothetical protein
VCVIRTDSPGQSASAHGQRDPGTPTHLPHAVARWKHYEQALARLLARLEVGSTIDAIPER